VKHIWRVVQIIPEYRGRVAAVLVVGVLVAAINTATPYIFKHVVDVIARLAGGTVGVTDVLSAVTNLVIGFAVLRLVVVVLGYVQQRQADNLWLDTVSTLRQRVFDNMTRLSLDYYERTRVGEIMDRFGTIPQINLWFRSLTEGSLALILQMIFIIGVLLVHAPAVGMIMLLVVPANLFVSYQTVQITKPHRRGWERLAGRLAGLLAEMVGNISTVRSFGGEAAVKRRYDGTQIEWKQTRGTLHRIEWRSHLTLSVVNALAIIASLALVVQGAFDGVFGAGDILFVLTLTQTLITSIQPITRLINQTGDIEASSERLIELIDIETVTADPPNAIALDRIETIEFERVGFSYPGKSRPVLADVSFRLNAGQTLALVGPSGAGKTTIIKLLMRFYEPTHGRVLINGRDLRDYRQQSLQRQLGVVLQDVALFNDSIQDNVAFARSEATLDEVRQATRAAHAEAFIERLPDGYDTLVGERGIKLSGGEKQRVAIARAILKDPQLIILDEATSALDSQSERLVQDGLRRLMTGRTAVVIAHRLSTIRSADQILVLRDGHVVQQGSHGALIKDTDGIYARLHALQTETMPHFIAEIAL
jgi:ABC-type multidrug transport system fused ATPase/permease subunit